MPRLEIEERARDLANESQEVFDRVAFAERALDLLRPKIGTIAIARGASRLRVELGRDFKTGRTRWALVTIPERASRRAIALELAKLGGDAPPYAMDLLLSALG